MVSTTTGQPAHAIILKPYDHADEYIVFVDDVAEYEQWKTDKSIALSRFVGHFAIYKSGTSGHTGNLGEVSKQEIENTFFGDEKNVKDKSVEAAIEVILTKGKKHEGNLEHSNKVLLNPARGHGDTRATGASRGSHR